eukprot:g41856.t1
MSEGEQEQEVEMGCDQEVRVAVTGQAEMIGKTVFSSTFGFTDREKTTSGALGAIDKTGGDAGEALSHLEGLFRALNGVGVCLRQGGENGVKVGRDKFCGAGACRNYGSAGVVRFVDVGEQVEAGSEGLGDYKAGGGGGEVAGSDEITDSIEDSGLMGYGGVMVKGK